MDSRCDNRFSHPVQPIFGLSARGLLALGAMVLCVFHAYGLANEPTAESDPVTTAAPSFERDVRPILAARCHDCHGADSQEARLDLRTLTGILRGGESGGAAIVPGQPKQSFLLTLIESGEMPPDDDRLDETQIAIIRRWIKTGAAAKEKVGDVRPLSLVSRKDRQFWAFQKPFKRPVPMVKQVHRVRTPIDAFILQKLETQGLTLSPDTDQVGLVRRACFDLIGLPPSPREVDAFLGDMRPDAYERLLDRLLDSPHYGERWGRHWLDVAGFVDVRLFDGDASIIYFNEGMWRYRDYVVDAFNADKPYDRFITEQLAGDELVDWQAAEEFTPAMKELLIATGYLRNVEDHTSEPQYGIKKRYDVVFGLVETVSTSLLGLTFDCARCHNHKFDPIPQRDYYRLMACFEPAYNVHQWLKPQDRFLADVAPKKRKSIDEHNAKLATEVSALQAKVKALEEASKKTNAKTPKSESSREATTTSKNSEKAALQRRIAELESARKTYGKIQALWESGRPSPSRLLRRGNPETPGVVLAAGFPEVLNPEDKSLEKPTATRASSSGRRLALARWLTNRDHPLTARVIVNRVWHHHFGVGIVSTPGNFGRSGSPPSHPELLDWLAVDFMENGWSLKRLHKQIMSSTVYRQSSERPLDSQAAAEKLDSENRLLWRQNLRRLEAEIVRDAVLAASGQLDRTQGGPPVMLTTPTDGLSQVKKEPTSTSHLRRSLYLLARRVYPLKFLEVFDSPIMAINCTQRMDSSTVLQSFTFLNGPFVTEQATHVAERVRARVGEDIARQVEFLYRLSLVRMPSMKEQKSCREFLAAQAKIYEDSGKNATEARRFAFADLCQMVLSTNEFLYVD